MKKFIATAIIATTPNLVTAQAGNDPFGFSFDDYLCHNVFGEGWLRPQFRLDMLELFGETQSAALRAAFICNPLEKRASINGNVVSKREINNPELHYMCYMFDLSDTDAVEKTFGVKNQFELEEYQSGMPQMICVPTLVK
jgi:hypothetical protein